MENDGNKQLNVPLLPLSPQTPRKVAVLMTSTQEKPTSQEKPKRRHSAHSQPRVRNTKRPVLDQVFMRSRSLEEIKEPRSNRRIKSFLYTILNPRSRQWSAVCFKWFISNIIVVDFIFFVVSTEPAYRETEYEVFQIAEGIFSSIFLIEYLARLFTITENKKFGDLGAFWGRLRWATTRHALIDTFATLPFFLELAFSGLELPKLSYLRIFRILRILKANGFVQATDAVWRVVYYNRQIMYMSVFVGLFMILTTSILMYYLRPRDNYKSDEFESILSTMYLSTLMLTGQGGPEGDLPWYTKGVVLLTSAFSIGMFAIPVSMLTWGFEAEAERCAKRTRQLEKRKTMRAMDSSTIAGSSSEEYSTDEEYQKIIAGEDTDDEDDEETKEALRLFLRADKDGSGSISLKEYMEFAQLNQNLLPGASDEPQVAIAARLSTLEKKVDDIAEKINRLCDELAPPKSIRWAK